MEKKEWTKQKVRLEKWKENTQKTSKPCKTTIAMTSSEKCTIKQKKLKLIITVIWN